LTLKEECMMRAQSPAGLKETQQCCNACHGEIKAGEGYSHHGRLFCEECCMDIRTPRARKTHWQYLGTIKTEYLRPGRTGES